jgi:hypothetical protein
VVGAKVAVGDAAVGGSVTGASVVGTSVGAALDGSAAAGANVVVSSEGAVALGASVGGSTTEGGSEVVRTGTGVAVTVMTVVVKIGEVEESIAGASVVAVASSNDGGSVALWVGVGLPGDGGNPGAVIVVSSLGGGSVVTTIGVATTVGTPTSIVLNGGVSVDDERVGNVVTPPTSIGARDVANVSVVVCGKVASSTGVARKVLMGSSSGTDSPVELTSVDAVTVVDRGVESPTDCDVAKCGICVEKGRGCVPSC